jgi:hypothetical protein
MLQLMDTRGVAVSLTLDYIVVYSYIDIIDITRHFTLFLFILASLLLDTITIILIS